MTKAYVSGRLTFDNVTSFSRYREKLILDEIESQEIAQAFYRKSLVYSAFAGRNPNLGKAAMESLSLAEEYALPHIFKQSKIDKRNNLSTDDLKNLKETLDKANAELQKQTK